MQAWFDFSSIMETSQNFKLLKAGQQEGPGWVVARGKPWAGKRGQAVTTTCLSQALMSGVPSLDQPRQLRDSLQALRETEPALMPSRKNQDAPR